MTDYNQQPPSLGDTSGDSTMAETSGKTPAVEKDAPKDVSNVPSLDVKALTDSALQFLATASNETLGACLAGLGAATYLVLGRVGLLLIGVVGGAALHATWDEYTRGGDSDGKGQAAEGRRELGVHIAHRILDWRQKSKEDKGNNRDDESDLNLKLHSGKELDYSDFRPETAAALNELTDAVVRDYVKYVEEPCLILHRSNAMQVVVYPHSTHRRPFSQSKSPNIDCFCDCPIKSSFPQATFRPLHRLHHSLVVVHHHNTPRAFQCNAGSSRRQCA
jgi:hypothetical protein